MMRFFAFVHDAHAMGGAMDLVGQADKIQEAVDLAIAHAIEMDEPHSWHILDTLYSRLITPAILGIGVIEPQMLDGLNIAVCVEEWQPR